MTAEWHQFLPLFPLARMEDSLAGGFGVAAAVLLVGGSILLRWQRSRQQFLLAQTALLQGLKPVSNAPPAWVGTLRQGITAIALGLGLLVVGALAYLMGVSVPDPKPPTTQEIAQAALRLEEPLRNGPPEDQRVDTHPPRGDRPFDPLGLGPHGLGDRDQGQPDQRLLDQHPPAQRDLKRDQQAGAPRETPPHPRFNAAVERWRFGQTEQTIGLLAIGSGIVLFLLGIVQIGFSNVERRHTPDGNHSTPSDPKRDANGV